MVLTAGEGSLMIARGTIGGSQELIPGAGPG